MEQFTEDNNRYYAECRIKIKKYLELENVSVLTGAGTSFHLGTPIIRKIPNDLKEKYSSIITKYFEKKTNPSLEDLLNCLQADRYLQNNKGENTEKIDEAIQGIQKWLYINCNTENKELVELYEDDDRLKNNRYYYHEMLIKKLLQRPNNLKRANLFTINYDMAFDYALDNLGVHYVNGFMGVHNRCFRPEVFEYDLYYPGESVAGKVHRAEKVLRYLKLHGSLSWVFTDRSVSNTYGIKEISLCELLKSKVNNEAVIYPCVSKKSFVLDLPYSELFRQFSQAIVKPQSVLFCIGYSFNDEHINDIIRLALSIPSFTLIIANYSPNYANTEIERLKKLDDKRIIVLEQHDSEISSFKGFVVNVMPDLYQEDEFILVAKTMQLLYPEVDNHNESKETNDIILDTEKIQHE